MHILKDFEAIFLIAAVLLCGAASATASVPGYKVATAVQSAQAETPMHVVTITGKRLSAAEKAALI
jgi:hypothetical protein